MDKIKVLDLGCGLKKKEGATGIDICPESRADIIWDLNKTPWPFPDNEFDYIICSHIIEHLDDIVRVMEEIYRIGKKDAVMEIIGPYFSNFGAFADPTHRHFFASTTFDYFCVNNELKSWIKYSSKAKFEKISYCIDFWKIPKLGGICLHKLLGIQFFANKFTSRYERFFAFIFPACEIKFKLKIIKPSPWAGY